jgi:hypothetical protein
MGVKMQIDYLTIYTEDMGVLWVHRSGFKVGGMGQGVKRIRRKTDWGRLKGRGREE